MGRELVVSHSDMNAAYARGEAVPLADSISWLTRYQDSWWVVYEGGWLRITDDLAHLPWVALQPGEPQMPMT